MFNSKKIIDFRPFDYWIILEKHTRGCSCTYCMREEKIKFAGFVSPKMKSWNSWWYFYLKILGQKYYLRFTGNLLFWKYKNEDKK